MTGEIRILIADDHALVRGALAERLQREPGLSVVATASTADEAITKTLQHSPDIVLRDIDMPGLICFDAAKRIIALRSETRIMLC